MSVHVSNKHLGVKLCEAMGIDPYKVSDISLSLFPGDVTRMTMTMLVPPAAVKAAFDAVAGQLEGRTDGE